MELTKTKWDISDKPKFIAYIQSLGSTKKEAWSRRILNTKMPLLCVSSKILDNIAREIFRGNYKSFLDLKMDDYYEVVAVYGKILTKIKDFDEMSFYLESYLTMMENWAHCDILSFKISVKNISKFIELSDRYKDSSLEFVRRFSIYILLLISRGQNINEQVFKRLESLDDEKHYYVVMMAAWLLCEVIIKHKEDAFIWLEKTSIQAGIMNKAIAKCRDSYRLTLEDKAYLLRYKK